MTIVGRLYVKEFFLSLFVVSLGLSAAMGLFDLIDKMSDLMKFSPDIKQLALYWLYVIPKYLKYLLPMAVLVCTFLVFGQAARFNEIVAIKAAGGKLKKVFFPFVLIGLLLCGVDFAVEEFLSSVLSQKAGSIFYKMVRGKDRGEFNAGDIWFMEKKGLLVNAEMYVPEKGLIKNLNVFYFDDNDHFAEIIKADNCEWTGKQWVLKNVIKYNLKDMEITRFASLTVEEIKSLNLYSEDAPLTEEMSFTGLYRYNKRLNEAGYSTQKTLVEMYTKLGYPFTCIFTMLTGIAFATRYRTGKAVINVGIALVISLVYWLTYTMSLSLGYSDILPPAFSALVTPVGFGAFGVYFYFRIPE